MCYDIVSATRAKLKYAKHRNSDPEYIKKLEEKLEKLLKDYQPKFHVSAFEFPKILAFTNEDPLEPVLLRWGLIPHWVKDKDQAKEIRNYNVNAKFETLFEKASFKEPARKKRCLIYIDAFYEHFHFNGQSYPYHIAETNGEPIAVAGVWDEWIYKETGEIIKTAAIVTTKANELLAKIHNNPKLEEPRMPLVLPKEHQDEWLISFENENTIKQLTELSKSVNSSYFSAHTVRKIKGKNAVGNLPEAEEEFVYNELWFLN